MWKENVVTLTHTQTTDDDQSRKLCLSLHDRELKHLIIHQGSHCICGIRGKVNIVK
jgi:hypothetical protein